MLPFFLRFRVYTLTLLIHQLIFFKSLVRTGPKKITKRKNILRTSPRPFGNYFKLSLLFEPYFYLFTAYSRLRFTRDMIAPQTSAILAFNVIFKKTLGQGFYALRAIFFVLALDALITDDEPLWEPLEWSLAQTWLLFIFVFAWIAENLITSRFGSYTGRDKRVWLAWYKSFWLIELIYVVSYGSAAMFVIVPFYYELTYGITFIFSWWSWYTKIFFFKFIAFYTFTLLTANFLLLNVKWLNWKKNLFLIFVVFSSLAYLLYTQFIITFFAYFTDPLWYQKTRYVDYIQLSHEPLKWGWGPAKRDHFTYHKVSTVFWFKNDSPFAAAFLMFNFFFFLCLFFLIFYWVILFRRVWSTKEFTYTFTVYCVSALKQFFFFFLLLFALIFISFIMAYWRFPIEFLWIKNTNSWFIHFLNVLVDYVF